MVGSPVKSRHKKRYAPAKRGSVRGAFGVTGALRRDSFQTLAQVSRAQHFQLDKCLDAKALDKLIYQMTSANDARQKAKLTFSQNADLTCARGARPRPCP